MAQLNPNEFFTLPEDQPTSDLNPGDFFTDPDKVVEPKLNPDDFFTLGGTENPELLYHTMKQNPGDDYTDEQIDTYLGFESEKEFSPIATAQALAGSVIPLTKQMLSGVGSLLANVAEAYPSSDNLIRGPKKESVKASASLVASTPEGGLRGIADLVMMAKSTVLNNSLSEAVDDDKTSVGITGITGMSARRKARGYAEFDEDKKVKLREKFRSLSDFTARRIRYENGDDTAMGDIAEMLLEGEEGEQAAAMLGGIIDPKSSELLSMILGPEGAAVKVASKIGKPVQEALGKGLLDTASSAVRTRANAAELAGRGAKPIEDFGNTARSAVTGKSHKGGLLSRAAEGLGRSLNNSADYIDGIRRQIGATDGENAFMRMSRDARLSPAQRNFSRVLGHTSMAGLPYISRGMRLASTPARSVVTATGSAVRSGVAGGLMVLPTWDEEMIGGSIASASALAFAGTTGGELLWGNQRRVNAAANNWVQKLQPDQQARLKERGFSNDQLARIATWEKFVGGISQGTTGSADVDFVYTDANSFGEVQQFLKDKGVDQEIDIEDVQSDFQKIVDNAGSTQQYSPTRGVQILNTRRPNAKPVVLVNLDKMSPTTPIHESIHAMQQLDMFQGYFQNIHGVLFDQPSRVKGEEGSVGMVSDADLDLMYEQYMDRVSQSEGESVASDLRKHDEELADRYAARNPNGLEAESGYWRRARMKSEVEADMFESLMSGRDPLYVTRAGLDEAKPLLQGPMGKMAGIIGRFIEGTTPPESLSAQGYKPRGSLINYENPELVAEVNSLINFGNRFRLADDGVSIQRPEVKENAAGHAYKPSQIKKGSALARAMAGSILAKTDENGNTMFDAEGKLVLEDSAKALRKKELVRAKRFLDVFVDQQYKADEGASGEPINFDPEAEKARDMFTGDYISEDAMLKIRNTPGMPADFVTQLEVLNGALKDGNVVELDYNARLIPKGKTKSQYSSLISSSLRYAIPFSVYLSKAGNMLVNTVDLTHLDAKYSRVMGDSTRSKRITGLWGIEGDEKATRNAFNESLVEYIGNTVNPGPEGLAKGLDADPTIAREKANVLSAFMGFKKKDIDFHNNRERQRAILDEMNPDREDNLIRSRRLDAINSVRPTDLPRMPLTRAGYRDVQTNRDVQFDPAPKPNKPVINKDLPVQKKLHKPVSGTKTRAKTKVDQILFAKVWKGKQVSDLERGIEREEFPTDEKGQPVMTESRVSSSKGFDIMITEKPKGGQGTKQIADPQQFYDRLDVAKAKVDSDPERFVDPNGYVEYMTDAGVYGDILVPPSGAKLMLRDPKQYVEWVKGGYHEQRTAPGTIEAAHEGLDSTVAMREAIGDTPPPMVTALHHLWGILSRMLPPVQQEAMWLRLISDEGIMANIQSSIDGNYDLTPDDWKASVQKVRHSNVKEVGGIGNSATANANSFHLMLSRVNGKWDKMSDVYKKDNDSGAMGRDFWSLVKEQGTFGIKNKVQRFIGLTFGTPALIMDRWKFVEMNLPMLMSRLDKSGFPSSSPSEFFEYSKGGVPEDPTGIYGTYGRLENASETFSMAFYEGMESVLQKSIENSSDIQSVLGKHQNVGGLHWVGWNAIKNESVGHSSLNLTFDLVKLFDRDKINAAAVKELIKTGTYYTEGLNGNKRQRITAAHGKFSLSNE